MMISEAEVRMERDTLARELAAGGWPGEEAHIMSTIDAFDFVLNEGHWADVD